LIARTDNFDRCSICGGYISQTQPVCASTTDFYLTYTSPINECNCQKNSFSGTFIIHNCDDDAEYDKFELEPKYTFNFKYNEKKKNFKKHLLVPKRIHFKARRKRSTIRRKIPKKRSKSG
jgi:hypothetical protein